MRKKKCVLRGRSRRKTHYEEKPDKKKRVLHVSEDEKKENEKDSVSGEENVNHTLKIMKKNRIT